MKAKEHADREQPQKSRARPKPDRGAEPWMAPRTVDVRPVDLLTEISCAPPISPQGMAQLQGTVGNQAVQRILERGTGVLPSQGLYGDSYPGGAGLVVQRDGPKGTMETSEGEEEIEGTTVTSSAEGITDRLAENEGNINVQINSWALEGVNSVVDGLQSAAMSFQNWYAARPRKPDTAGFVFDVMGGVTAVLGAAFPPAAVASAVAGALLNLAKAPVSQALDANAKPDEQARQIGQNMLKLGETLRAKFAGFGPRLKQQAGKTWSDIGIALTMQPPVIQIAQDELYTQTGVPRPGEPYGERFLSEMVYKYLDWETRSKLKRSRFFISPESVEYALFTDKVRARLRKQAGAEAGKMLGASQAP